MENKQEQNNQEFGREEHIADEQTKHDQLVILAENARETAERAVINDQHARANGRKIDIIGTAVIEQRDKAEEMASINKQTHEDLLTQVEVYEKQSDRVKGLMHAADERMQVLEQTHTSQQNLMDSFGTMQKKHQELVEINQENYEAYSNALENMVEAAKQLKSRIEQVYVADQTDKILENIDILDRRTHEYIEKRSVFQSELRESVRNVEKDIDYITDAIGRYQNDIMFIKGTVLSCDKQTKAIDNKLNDFMEKYDVYYDFNVETLDGAFEQPAKEAEQTEGKTQGFFGKLFGGGHK